MLHKQQILTDLKLASLLKYMGYPVTAKSDPLGTQYLVTDPCDLQEAIDAYESGTQVADAKKLLETYEETRKTQNGQFRPVAPRVAQATLGDCVELLPGKITAQKNSTWVTEDFNTANLLMYRGNSLLETHLKAGRTEFTFARDEGLNEVISLFNQKKLRVDPHQWALAGFKTRDAMRNLKGYGKNSAPWR